MGQRQRRRESLNLPKETWDRINFWQSMSGGGTREEIVQRMIRLYDSIVGSMILEGSKLFLVHRDGTKEVIVAPDQATRD